MISIQLRKFFTLIFLPLILLGGCSTMSHFDQNAYDQIITVEADALALMDKATDSYSTHEKEITAVTIRMQKAYLYDKNRPKNKITEDMWKLMMDPNGTLYGSFIAFWKKNDKVSLVFISQAKKVLQPEFDRIAQLESKKIKN